LPSEIVIVDQSDDDATCRIVQERRDLPVKLVYVRQQQRGLSAARNEGVSHATCSIVAVTDDDCVPGPQWVAALLHAFSRPHPLDAVTGRVLPLGPERTGYFPVSSRGGARPAEFSGKVLPWQVGTGGNSAVRREWFRRIGLYDERLGVGSPGRAAEDTDLLYRLLRAGARIRYEPDALIYHERQPEAQRFRRRWSYGYGMGAFCGIWIRRRDGYALYMLARWLLRVGRMLLLAIGQRDVMMARQRLLSIGGTLGGLVYGVRLSPRGDDR
jgi:cellulose synthase/poly-beta-1,6-N-acetylglucosamine synthase-like glycosyltransferase